MKRAKLPRLGKAMSIADEMMETYFVLTLGYKAEEAARLLAEVAAGSTHPRDLKARLAQVQQSMTENLHGNARRTAHSLGQLQERLV